MIQYLKRVRSVVVVVVATSKEWEAEKREPRGVGVSYDDGFQAQPPPSMMMMRSFGPRDAIRDR